MWCRKEKSTVLRFSWYLMCLTIGLTSAGYTPVKARAAYSLFLGFEFRAFTKERGRRGRNGILCTGNQKESSVT